MLIFGMGLFMRFIGHVLEDHPGGKIVGLLKIMLYSALNLDNWIRQRCATNYSNYLFPIRIYNSYILARYCVENGDGWV